MSKIDVSNMDLYYGDFHALKNINLSIDANEVTAFIGPSGCGKSTLLKSINRMNDLVPGCRITGEMLLDGENIYGGKNGCQRTPKTGRHGIPETKSVPDEHLRQYCLWPQNPWCPFQSEAG